MTAIDFTPNFKNPFGTTVTWTSVGTALPGGLTLDPATGRISGDIVGNIEGVILRVSDGVHQAHTNPFRVGPLSPVTAGMTHWSEADDPILTSSLAGHDYIDDKSGFTYVGDVGAGTRAVLRLSAGAPATAYEVVPNSLNGKPGIRVSSLVSLREFLADLDGNPAESGDIAPDAGCTIQVLMRHLDLPIANDASLRVLSDQLWLRWNGVDSIYADSGPDGALFASDGAVHLVTITYDSTNVRVYVDDDFATAVYTDGIASVSATGDAFVIGNPAAVDPSTSPTLYAVLTYARVLTAEELTQNVNYLRGAARWGPAAF